jgi:hypothetical protein
MGARAPATSSFLVPIHCREFPSQGPQFPLAQKYSSSREVWPYQTMHRIKNIIIFTAVRLFDVYGSVCQKGSFYIFSIKICLKTVEKLVIPSMDEVWRPSPNVIFCGHNLSSERNFFCMYSTVQCSVRLKANWLTRASEHLTGVGRGGSSRVNLGLQVANLITWLITTNWQRRAVRK